MRDFLRYAKAWAIVAMVTRGAAVAAVALPVIAMVATGGADINLTVRLGV